VESSKISIFGFFNNAWIITDGERAACRRVTDAFREIYSADLLVLDAGRYGFVKLQYFHPPFGYDEAGIFTTSRDLFNDLWRRLMNKAERVRQGTPPIIGWNIRRPREQKHLQNAGLVAKLQLEGIPSAPAHSARSNRVPATPPPNS